MSRATLLALGLAALLCGCGVVPQSDPAPIPGDRLPTPAASDGDGVPRATGRVWGAREGRLIPVPVQLSQPTVRARVRALLRLSEPDQRPPTMIPRGVTLLSLSQRNDTVQLTVSSELLQTPQEALPVALGQLVLTVTEDSTARRVQVRVGRSVVPLVDATGQRVVRPLERSDFAGITPPGTPND